MFKRSAVKLFILLVTLGSFHFVTQDVSAIDYEAELDFNNQIPQDRPFMDGSVVFESNMNGNWDIYYMDGQGNNLRQLTFSSSDERWPTISPDGSHFAYTSNRDGFFNIVVQDLYGDRQFNLTHNGSNEMMPDWGPWDQIIFVSDVNGNKDIFLKNVWGTPEEQGFGQSESVPMTFTPQDENAPAFAGEAYGNIFAYEVDGNIWGYNLDDFRNWPIREGGEDERDPVFHPYDSIKPSREMQPQFMFLKNDQLYWSNIGWQNNFSQEGMPVRIPGTLNYVAFSKDDPCTIAFTTKEGGKIGLVNHCDPGSNAILLPDGNSNFGAQKIAYGRGQGGGMMGGMMGGMRDMGDKMMQDMQRQEDERMRMEQERMDEQMRMDRERMEEQDRMNQEMMERQMEADRERMEMERERTEMQMDADRERMEQEREMREERDRMDREMMDEQMRMEQERMEQQREMMRNMDGDGGRDDFFEPEERCFIEDEEESRGLFGNIDIGTEIDCGKEQGFDKRLQDPTTLAMLGLVVTVGATLLQMLRGN